MKREHSAAHSIIQDLVKGQLLFRRPSIRASVEALRSLMLRLAVEKALVERRGVHCLNKTGGDRMRVRKPRPAHGSKQKARQ